MKRIVLAILLMTMVMGASAQTDGFFKDGGYDDNGTREIATGSLPRLPQGTVGGSNDDQAAPLGSGLVILTALGAGYVIKRSRELKHI